MNLDKKYRPKTFKEVIGQDNIVKSLKYFFNGGIIPIAFLFTGNSGTGKTTLARIIASMMDVNQQDIIEIDAATYTGVAEMKSVAESLIHKSMFGNGRKFLILDECQMLSKAAWNSWLKVLEEPPSHLTFALCTTEPTKVPLTIKSRCHAYKLNDLKYEDLVDLVCEVAAEEVLVLPSGAEDLIATEANGNARQALVYLSQVASVSTIEEAIDIIKSSVKSDDVIKLCRLIAKKENSSLKSLSAAISLLKNMRDLDMYGVWKTIREYLTTCIINNTDERDLVFFLNLLEKTNTSRTVEFSDIVLIVSDMIMNKKY